jgi:hypothetical protein
MTSEKYPRSFHLPWSPGATSDDKIMQDISGLLNVPLVFTEKLDGSNMTFSQDEIFARTHSGPPTHPSFNIAKATYAGLKHRIPKGISIFLENCYAIHTIEYGGLPRYSFMFGVRNDSKRHWWGWDDVRCLAEDLELETVPELFRGTFTREIDLRKATEKLATEPSVFGGIREGLVARVLTKFDGEDFTNKLGKWVRKDHVQTDAHWMTQAIRPQKLIDY